MEFIEKQDIFAGNMMLIDDKGNKITYGDFEDIYEKEDQKNPVTGHIVFDINGDDACSGSGCKSDSNYSQNENLLQKR